MTLIATRTLGVSALSVALWLAVGLTMPAIAQGVKLAELQGSTVDATVVRAVILEQNGKVLTGQTEVRVELLFEPGRFLRERLHRTSRFAESSPRTTSRYRRVYIGIAKKARAGSGSGYSVAAFVNGTLAFLTTLSKGARKLEIKFARGSDGLTCTARELHLREQDVDGVVSASPSTHVPSVVLKERLVSQTCRVTKLSGSP